MKKHGFILGWAFLLTAQLTAPCVAFNAHVNHIAAAAGAGAAGKSCRGRRRMSGAGNLAQFGNHDATKSARLPSCRKIFLIYGALQAVDILTSAKMGTKHQKSATENTCDTFLVILGSKVFWLQKSDQPHLSSSLRPDIDILRHNSQAVVHEGPGKHCIYDLSKHKTLKL